MCVDLNVTLDGLYRRLVTDFLVDDDSYVFPQRFFKLLGWHDPTSEALYMGDFLVRYPGSKPSDFACGGSGSTFSIRALHAMRLNNCTNTLSSRCLMSDWMISMCAEDPYVNEPVYRMNACDTCLLGTHWSNVNDTEWRIRNNDCFFMQNFNDQL